MNYAQESKTPTGGVLQNTNGNEACCELLRSLIAQIPNMTGADFKYMQEYVGKHQTISMDLIDKLLKRIDGQRRS